MVMSIREGGGRLMHASELSVQLLFCQWVLQFCPCCDMSLGGTSAALPGSCTAASAKKNIKAQQCVTSTHLHCPSSWLFARALPLLCLDSRAAACLNSWEPAPFAGLPGCRFDPDAFLSADAAGVCWVVGRCCAACCNRGCVSVVCSTASSCSMSAAGAGAIQTLKRQQGPAGT
jgi:hypothetical protein